MANWLKRWLLVSGVVTTVLLLLAGTVRNPWIWAYASVGWATTFYAFVSLSEDLARERYHPPNSGADAIALHFVRIVAMTHIVVGVLDSTRWHLTSPVPPTLRAL